MPVESLLQFDDSDKGIVVDTFSDTEAKELDTFVTNATSNVFAWKIGDALTPEQAGALLSRYSRTSLNGRRLFLKEFLPNKNRGREFFESWLVDYGDDSIQEMAGGLPVSCEYISCVAAKDIEDGRLASYIEKSTRYVSFDKKLPNGEYMFYKDPDILNSRFGDEYLELMRGLFDSYSKFTDKMSAYIKETNPIDSQTFRITNSTVRISELTKEMEERLGVLEADLRKSYDNAIKANALDFMRDYLPMATLTHVGINANARSYESIIIKLMSSPLAENRHLGRMILQELMKISPSLVHRVGEKHGIEYQKVMSERTSSTRSMVKKITDANKPGEIQDVDLLEYTGKGTPNPNEAAEIAVVSAIIYRFGEGQNLSQTKRIATSMASENRKQLLSTYIGDRVNRRHKPGRAFESVDYTFDFTGRVGIYRDIQRHRIGTLERQIFSTALGYNSRSEYSDIGIIDDYTSKMEAVKDLYAKISETMPYQAQYAVTFGFNVKWYYKMNARQLYHFCELRTSPAGHPDYRTLVQHAYSKVKEVHPSMTSHMGFIDMSSTKLGRLNAEIRIAQKKNAAEPKP